jgi:hypothetical protein
MKKKIFIGRGINFLYNYNEILYMYSVFVPKSVCFINRHSGRGPEPSLVRQAHHEKHGMTFKMYSVQVLVIFFFENNGYEHT